MEFAHLEAENVDLLPSRAALQGLGLFSPFRFVDVAVGTVVANNHAIALFGSVGTAAQVISQNVV
jgi:hypothetical protein